MPFPGQDWPVQTKVVACIFHVLAIVSGVFRTTYRWYISRFGWDDIWATVALLADIGCLIYTWVARSVPSQPSRTDIIMNWVGLTLLNSTPWGARLSMITAIIRIANPRATVRRISYAIAIAFGLMWTVVFAQKLYDCGTQFCRLTHRVAVSQLITDGIADALLVLAPILLTRGAKLSRSQRVLLVLSFVSSIGITILSIAQLVYLFLPITSTSLLLTHTKAALSVVVCNMLVVTTFVYRVYHKTDMDPGDGSIEETEDIQLTTVVLE